MQTSAILTQLYKILQDESKSEASTYDLEMIFESGAQAASRFDFNSAIPILLNVLTGLQAIPPSKKSLHLQVRCLIELGNIRRDQGFVTGYQGAQQLYQRAKTIAESLGEKSTIAELLLYLGACNEMQKQYIVALHYYGDALELIDVLGGMEYLRGRVLLRIGTILTKTRSLDEAERTLLRSLNLLEGRTTIGGFGHAQQKLAIVYKEQKKLDSALRIVTDTIKAISKESTFRLTQTKILAADLLFSMGDEDEALEEVSQAENMAVDYGFSHQLNALYSMVEKHSNSYHKDLEKNDISLRKSENPDSTFISSDPRYLRFYDLLKSGGSFSSLQQISSHLGVKYENLSGASVSEKANSLLIQLKLLGKEEQLESLLSSKTTIHWDSNERAKT